MKINNHIMVDIECLGVSAGCGILSIGAVAFDVENGVYDTFYQLVRQEHWTALTIDANTWQWWQDRDPEFLRQCNQKGKTIRSSLEALDRWTFMITGDPTECHVWANGSAFDFPILDFWFNQCQIRKPWTFRNERCYRTLRAMYPDVYRKPSLKPHNALADAQAQAENTIEILRQHA